MSRFVEDKSAIPSFDRIEKISGTLVPSGTKRDRQTWTARYFLWLQDQKERATVSTERTHDDGGEAHENPWRPSQPSEDAKEWNGVEGLDGALPGVDFGRPATPPATDGPIVLGAERNEEQVLHLPRPSTHN
jgi:hypothetical protein